MAASLIYNSLIASTPGEPVPVQLDPEAEAGLPQIESQSQGTAHTSVFPAGY
ncbi:hypothetical protein JOB18_019681 [Solea senegalensis]|uniref:Uncharacterized protein n=1 Tax=Solea senegalensis TaxID=28829 RepID=A0AAV6T6B8_SOLSE|nr:hypothetical protein JOB18_019681 [Solea senegalensis]